MEAMLIAAGASILGLMGAIHFVYTLYSDKFEAFDSKVTEAMKLTSPVISRDTSVWQAWIGFNLSHSLGALLLAAFYIPLSLFHFELIETSRWFSMLPLLIAMSYLSLAVKYWFKVPALGIAMATLCFLLAALMINT